MSGATNDGATLLRTILRFPIGVGHADGAIRPRPELTATVEDLVRAVDVLEEERPELGPLLDPAAAIIARRRGLPHWLLWGVDRVLGPDACGYGATVDGEQVQLASGPEQTTKQCSCAWWREHYAAGRPCVHLLALELAIETCEQARVARRAARRPRGAS